MHDASSENVGLNSTFIGGSTTCEPHPARQALRRASIDTLKGSWLHRSMHLEGFLDKLNAEAHEITDNTIMFFMIRC